MVCKCHTVTFRPEICVKMSIFKVDVQSDHIETKCSRVKVSQGKNVTVDVSSGSKCHRGRNVGGRNIKASADLGYLGRVGGGFKERWHTGTDLLKSRLLV